MERRRRISRSVLPGVYSTIELHAVLLEVDLGTMTTGVEIDPAFHAAATEVRGVVIASQFDN